MPSKKGRAQRKKKKYIKEFLPIEYIIVDRLKTFLKKTQVLVAKKKVSSAISITFLKPKSEN